MHKTDRSCTNNNTQTDNAKNIDVVMPMYNLIEYRNNYLKALGSLWAFLLIFLLLITMLRLNLNKK